MGLTDSIRETYSQAAKEVKKKLDEYTKHYKAQIAVMQKRLESGKISQEDYNDWLERQIFRGKRWQEKLDDITKTYVDADGTARELVGDRSKNVFARFANSTARDIQNRFNGGVSFDMYDRHAVERLLKENPQMLPEWKINEKKDYRWNAQRVQNAITQGIIQGESIPQLTKRLTSELSAGSAKHMTLFARTAMTGAQNAGRIERLHEAQDMGIVVKKKWLTAGDDDVRDAHKDLNGVEVGVDEKFKVMVKGKEYEIDYPGDPTADPALVYNCRCTLTYVYDVKASRENLQEREPEAPPKPAKREPERIEYTRNERSAIESYVSGETMWLNQYLRNPSEFGDLSDDEKALLKDLKAATEKQAVKDKRLYRAVDAQAVFGRMSDLDFENLRAALIYGDTSRPAQSALDSVKAKIGKEVKEKGFMSTTRDVDIAAQWNGYTGSMKDIVLEFDVPDGIKGFDVENAFEVEEEQQREVLLQSGLSYTIDGIEKRQTEDGTVIVVKATIRKR